MEKQSRVISMNKTPAGRYVRINLENGHKLRLTPNELRCFDVRVGDMVSYSPFSPGFGVRLDQRPAAAMPYQA